MPGPVKAPAQCCGRFSLAMVPCREHRDAPHECPDALVVRAEGGGYGLSIKDGGRAYLAIRYCPFCGKELR